MTREKTLRLIYIHGFQGDHTSFQALPTDLHGHLRPRLPPRLALESCLYPTYKSRRPVSEAAEKFVDWLSTQPPGPVILLAHSMGGLLAAEVATGTSKQSKRIIGLVNFDVPYLGMHPHVIISGIASLLPGDKGKGEKTEEELNDENVVTHVHGSDVENARVYSDDASSVALPEKRLPHPSPSQSSSSFSSQVDDEWEAMKTNLQPPSGQSQSSLSPYRSSSPLSASSSSTSLVSSIRSATGAYIMSKVPPLVSPLAAKLERAAERILSQHSDSPFLRWLLKHADDPLSAMTTWIVEHFEYGICMFDPAGLRERYKALERWDGRWVNFWTEVPARGADKDGEAEIDEELEEEEEKDIKGSLPSNTADVAHFADIDGHASEADARAHAKARKAAGKALRRERTCERRGGKASSRPARHFIVLPHLRHAPTESLHFGSLERWERVRIWNVDDEVEAHCGLFIRSSNPEYEKLVERVAEVIIGWCDGL